MGDRYYCMCFTSGCGEKNQRGVETVRSEQVCRSHIANDQAHYNLLLQRQPTWTPTTTLEIQAFARTSLDGLTKANSRAVPKKPKKRPSSPPSSSEHSHSDLGIAMDIDAEVDVGDFNEDFGGGGEGDEEQLPHYPTFSDEDRDDRDYEENQGSSEEEDESDSEKELEPSDEEDLINRILKPSPRPQDPDRSSTPALADSDEDEDKDEDGEGEEEEDFDFASLITATGGGKNSEEIDDDDDDDNNNFRPECLLPLDHTPGYEPPTEENRPTAAPPTVEITDHQVESLRHLWIHHRGGGTVRASELHRKHKGELGKFEEGELLSNKVCERKLRELSGVTPQVIDACRFGCQAFTGSYSDDKFCSQERPKAVLGVNEEELRTNSGAIKKSNQVCNEPRYKHDGKTPNHTAVFYDFVPFISASFRNKETNQLMQYFVRELRRVTKQFGERFEQSSRPVDDIPHGTWAYEHSPFFFEDEFGRRTAFAVTFDGAQLDSYSKNDFWIWALQVFNFSPEEGRYQLQYFYPILISFGEVNPRSLDSFSLPIYQRIFDSYTGFWLYDGLREEYFLWKGKLVASLADLVAQNKNAGAMWITGRVGCPDCDQISVTKESGKGCYYCRGGSKFYSRGGNQVRRINPNQKSGGYEGNGRKAKEVTNESYYKQLDEISKATGTAHKALGSKYGIRQVPQIASLPYYDRAAMHPPDYAHLLANNCVLAMIKLWMSIPGMPEALERVEEMYESTRKTWPSQSMGAFPRGPRAAHSSSPKLYEMDRWISLFSLPCLKEAGFSQVRLDHWALFVELYKIVSRPGGRTLKDCARVDELAEEFNRGIETIYVEYKLENVGAFPLCFHRLLHLSKWMIKLGNLVHYSQLPLERYMQIPKRAGKSSPRSPFQAMVNKMTKTARFMICRLLFPEAFERVMRGLDDFKKEQKVADWTVKSELSQKLLSTGPFWKDHLRVLSDFLVKHKLQDHLKPYSEQAIKSHKTYGTATLRNGMKVSSERRTDKLERKSNKGGHDSSWVTLQQSNTTGGGQADVLFGQVIGFYRLPFAPETISASHLFATIILYGPVTSEYQGGILSVEKSSKEARVVAVEQIEEVVAVMDSLDSERLFILKKGFVPGFIEELAKEKDVDEVEEDEV
ncbi:hypothetical protein JCM5350_002783 [Sporobolomyces pararoseus]